MIDAKVSRLALCKSNSTKQPDSFAVALYLPATNDGFSRE